MLADVATPFGTMFDTIEFITSNVMLPLGALLIVVFAGWVMCRNSTSDELKMGSGLRYHCGVRGSYIAPIASCFRVYHSWGC